MRRIAAVLLLVGCAKPQPASEVTVAPLPSATAAPTASATVLATVMAAPSDSTPPPPPPPPPAIDTRCAPGQLNVPCVFQSNGKCFERRANCSERPCTEAPPVQVSCDVHAKAREATACDVVRACRGVSDEGCVEDVHCTPRMPTCVEKSCAPRILAATGCSMVPASCIK